MSAIDINNLGTFSSFAALWARYPEGGNEGDYVTVGGLRYRWNKYTRSWSAVDQAVSNGVTRQTFYGDVDVYENLRVAGTLYYKHLKGYDLGLFTNLTALQTAYPNPEVGMYALTPDSTDTTKYHLYSCSTAGTWTLITEEASLDMFDAERYERAVQLIETLAAGGSTLSGFVPLLSVNDLPEDPTPKTLGYIIDNHLYLWVGEGGDTADGKYKDCGLLQGAKGDKGDKGDNGVVLDGVTVFDQLDDLGGLTETEKEEYIPDGNLIGALGALHEQSRLTGNIIHQKTLDGKYIDSSGDVATSSSYATHVYVVRKGFTFIHVEAKIGTSAYITVRDKAGNILKQYKGVSNPYTYSGDIFLDEGAFIVQIPAMYSGTLTVTDGIPGDYTNKTYSGEVADLLGTEIPWRQGYLNEGWTKAVSYGHYVVPIKPGVASIIIKTNTLSMYGQFFASYSSAVPYTAVNSGAAPTYTLAENCNNDCFVLAEDTEHIISVPRNAKFLYLSATADRKPVSMIFSEEHFAEKAVGMRLTPTSVTANKYLNSSGSEVSYTGAKIYTYDVEGRKTLYIKTRIPNLAVVYFKDATSNVVGKFIRQWYSTSGINTDAVYNVPSGAFTMYLSTVGDYELVVSDVSETETGKPENMFATKKVAFLGDSITNGVGATDTYHRYSSMFSSIARCFEVNLGSNGTCLAANTKNGKTADRFITRATQANIGDADVIFVFGCTNDFTYDNKAIGDLFVETTISKTEYRGTKRKTAPSDNETFAGALHELILHIRDINPTARLIYIAPMTRGVWHKSSTPPTSSETNYNGDYLQDYIHAIREICLFYSVPVVDMTSLMNQYWGNDSEDGGVLQSLDDDGIHPNNLGHERMARVLFNYCIHNIYI